MNNACESFDINNRSLNATKSKHDNNNSIKYKEEDDDEEDIQQANRERKSYTFKRKPWLKDTSRSKRMHEIVESGAKYRTNHGDAKKKDQSDP